MSRRLVNALWLSTLALACQPAAAASTAAPAVAASTTAAGKLDIKQRAMEALAWGDFDELVLLQREAGESRQPNGDGLTQMVSYMAGLGDMWNIGAPDATDAYFENLDAVTAGWLKAHPRSPLAAALRMRALYARAWFYRGHGYADSISPQQAALYGRYIEQALQVAREAGFGPDDEMGHIYLIMVARSAGMDWNTQRALAESHLARHPDTYEVWQELVISAEPKWGGSWALVSRTVLDAATRQHTPEEGDIMYAQLWDDAWYELEAKLFEAPVDWLRVKRGMRALLARTPGTRMVNAFARLACLRRDRAAAQEAMEQIGDAPELDFWGRGTSGRSAFDQCRRWLRQPETLPPEITPVPGRPGGDTPA